MECVAFNFLNKHVGRHFMAIFQDDNVKIHWAQSGKEWLGGNMKNHVQRWIGTSESRPWKPLGCAGGDFTEGSTLALSVQDPDQLLMHHLVMKINVMLFP